MCAMGGLTHALLTTSNNNIAVASENRLITHGNSTYPGAADLIDSHGGAVVRDAG